MRALSVLLCLVNLAFVFSAGAEVESQARPRLGPIVDAWISDHEEELLEFYRQRHANPELSLSEQQSAAAVSVRLGAAGYDVTEGVGGHGVVGVLANGDGPTVLIRGDMDALPITEATELEYQSTSVGVMHACGHDIHMTNLVGTAAVLAATRDSWQGTVVVIAQPAEEIGRGAAAMIGDGLGERFPRPDYCLGLHVAAELPAGSVALTPGWATANVDSVDITIFGVGGHGSQPHKTVDPVITAAHVIVALQTVVSRRSDPMEPAVVTVGSVHAGSKHNIIPDQAKLQLTVRSFADETRRTLLDGIGEVTINTCRAMGCQRDPEVVIREQEYTPSGYNNPDLAAAATLVMEGLLGANQVHTVAPVTLGEDFARYARHFEVPGLLFWLGSVAEADFEAAQQGGPPLPALHTATYHPDPPKTIRTGIRCTAGIALSLLGAAF